MQLHLVRDEAWQIRLELSLGLGLGLNWDVEELEVFATGFCDVYRLCHCFQFLPNII